MLYKWDAAAEWNLRRDRVHDCIFNESDDVQNVKIHVAVIVHVSSESPLSGDFVKL